MYNEESYINHLKWIKVRKVALIVFLTIFGCVIGTLISAYAITILEYASIFRYIIIACFTIFFFLISLGITANATHKIQEGYWKVATLRKLTLISKKLDSLEKLENLGNNTEILERISKVTEQISKNDNSNTSLIENPEKRIKKVKKIKKKKVIDPEDTKYNEEENEDYDNN